MDPPDKFTVPAPLPPLRLPPPLPVATFQRQRGILDPAPATPLTPLPPSRALVVAHDLAARLGVRLTSWDNLPDPVSDPVAFDKELLSRLCAKRFAVQRALFLLQNKLCLTELRLAHILQYMELRTAFVEWVEWMHVLVQPTLSQFKVYTQSTQSIVHFFRQQTLVSPLTPAEPMPLFELPEVGTQTVPPLVQLVQEATQDRVDALRVQTLAERHFSADEVATLDDRMHPRTQLALLLAIDHACAEHKLAQWQMRHLQRVRAATLAWLQRYLGHKCKCAF